MYEGSAEMESDLGSAASGCLVNGGSMPICDVAGSRL